MESGGAGGTIFEQGLEHLSNHTAVEDNHNYKEGDGAAHAHRSSFDANVGMAGQYQQPHPLPSTAPKWGARSCLRVARGWRWQHVKMILRPQ